MWISSLFYPSRESQPCLLPKKCSALSRSSPGIPVPLAFLTIASTTSPASSRIVCTSLGRAQCLESPTTSISAGSNGKEGLDLGKSRDGAITLPEYEAIELGKRIPASNDGL